MARRYVIKQDAAPAVPISGIDYRTALNEEQYAASPSLDAALERVVAHGGRVALPRQALPPGMGFYAHIHDLDGNRVGLHALS